MMRGWQRKIWRWRIIYSRGWIHPDLGIRILIVSGGKRRWQGWSLAIVNDAQWQRSEQRRKEVAADNLRILRAM